MSITDMNEMENLIGEVVDCVQALVGLRAGFSEWGPSRVRGPHRVISARAFR